MFFLWLPAEALTDVRALARCGAPLDPLPGALITVPLAPLPLPVPLTLLVTSLGAAPPRGLGIGPLPLPLLVESRLLLGGRGPCPLATEDLPPGMCRCCLPASTLPPLLTVLPLPFDFRIRVYRPDGTGWRSCTMDCSLPLLPPSRLTESRPVALDRKLPRLPSVPTLSWSLKPFVSLPWRLIAIGVSGFVYLQRCFSVRPILPPKQKVLNPFNGLAPT